MKRSIRGILCIAMAAAMAVATFAANMVEAAYTVCRAAKYLLVDGFMASAAPQPGQPEVIPFVRDRAFVLRIAKRERPKVTSSWRMCPST